MEYLKLYVELDKEVFRIYPAVDSDDASAEKKGNSAAQHWMTTENTCISFFASIAQFAPYDSSSVSDVKRARITKSLKLLLEKMRAAEVSTDPLELEAFETIRRGMNARKVNIGSYTRRLLSNGLKELYREEGEMNMTDAWNLAVD